MGYSEDEASKRVRVARLASRFPRVLDELRAGAVHLTGLVLIAHYLTEENHERLMARARGKLRREIEQLTATEFPKDSQPRKRRFTSATKRTLSATIERSLDLFSATPARP